jgi:hypothetical protein
VLPVLLLLLLEQPFGYVFRRWGCRPVGVEHFVSCRSLCCVSPCAGQLEVVSVCQVLGLIQGLHKVKVQRKEYF